MSEQVQQEQTPVDRADALKAKRAGQTCITVFVVFLVSLLSFGKAPISRVAGTDGSRVNFNLISCLGVAMGVFAFFFLLLRLKGILRLSMTRKALGLIGSLGLIAHTILAFLPLSYAARSVQPAGTAGNRPLGVGGSEQWVIDGKTYRISSTYHLQLPEGFQFTIEHPYRFGQAHRSMNDARALEIALPLMKYAYANGLHKRTSVTKLGQGKVVPSRIGVVLVERQGGTARGYRVALGLQQIKERMERMEPETPVGSDVPPDPDGARR